MIDYLNGGNRKLRISLLFMCCADLVLIGVLIGFLSMQPLFSAQDNLLSRIFTVAQECITIEQQQQTQIGSPASANNTQIPTAGSSANIMR